MLTSTADLAPNGKENRPGHGGPSFTEVKPPKQEKSKKRKAKDQSVDGYVTGEEFDQLLDHLQIPDNMRQKLATMDTKVKAAFLKSSKEMAIMKPIPPPGTPRGLRKAHSSESLCTPKAATNHSIEHSNPFKLPDHPKLTGIHSRGVSYDLSRQNLAMPVDLAAAKKGNKEKRGKNATVTPAKWCTILTSVSTIQLEVETIKKLRLLLRNEPTNWTLEFLQDGGYPALLSRLKEILEVEWREEQHDDQILHELLRCFKALSTSAVGCTALRSYCPAPYAQLVSLLYSDKRPGEVGTRQLILELLLMLFDLYPPSALPAIGSPMSSASPYGHTRTQSAPWESEISIPFTSSLVVLPSPHVTTFSFVKSLLLTPAPPPAEETGPTVEPHAFIEEIHRPRVYKTYMEELNNLCRDYFWVFCHPNNTIWNLSETDEGKVEKPRAPGGMTGGVEFEAMTYLTTHFRFLNALARSVEEQQSPQADENSAYQFHSDMFLSGLERIITMVRKASTTYYPTLHLEIARYVAALGRSGFEIPWSISRLIGAPPSNMRKHVSRTPRSHDPNNMGRSSTSAPSTPTKKSSTPVSALPGVRKVTPMFG